VKKRVSIRAAQVIAWAINWHKRLLRLAIVGMDNKWKKMFFLGIFPKGEVGLFRQSL